MMPDLDYGDEYIALPLVAPVGFLTLAPARIAEDIKQFPLVPGVIWNEITAVVWNVLPRSKFMEGARAMDLPRARMSDGSWDVTTTQEELAMLILWAWEHK